MGRLAEVDAWLAQTEKAALLLARAAVIGMAAQVHEGRAPMHANAVVAIREAEVRGFGPKELVAPLRGLGPPRRCHGRRAGGVWGWIERRTAHLRHGQERRLSRTQRAPCGPSGRARPVHGVRGRHSDERTGGASGHNTAVPWRGADRPGRPSSAGCGPWGQPRDQSWARCSTGCSRLAASATRAAEPLGLRA